MILNRFPCSVLYEIDDDVIRVTAIRHPGINNRNPITGPRTTWSNGPGERFAGTGVVHLLLIRYLSSSPRRTAPAHAEN